MRRKPLQSMPVIFNAVLFATTLVALRLVQAFVPIRQTVASPSRAARRLKVALEFGVVITGGANGVGFALADEMLSRGHAVAICDIKDTALPVKALKLRHGPRCEVYGTRCDVSSSSDVQALAKFARQSLG